MFIDFLGYKNLKQVPARVDTGARTSSLWASNIRVRDGIVSFRMFDQGAPWYTGKVIRRPVLETREVTSSTGHVQQRYVVAMRMRVDDKRIRTKFTLADRATQMYPILLGRNILRGHFLVDASLPGDAALYKYPEEAQEFNEVEE